MKQYDKVVGEILEEDEVQGKYIREESHQNVIVLTAQELKDLAIAMVKEWVEDTSDGTVIEEEVANDLHNYLITKGLSI